MRPRPKFNSAKIVKDRADLSEVVIQFTRAFAELENVMAQLLHNIVFFKDHVEWSRVAHAIYFTPDGFGGRQALVNNAITEWFAEHPLGNFNFQAEWNCINHRLNTLRGVRNLIAHGAVNTVMIHGEFHVRVTPPTYDPKLVDRVSMGSKPGMDIKEIELINRVLLIAAQSVATMGFLIAEHDYGETTWQKRFDELADYRNRLNSLYPADQTPKACKDQPPPSPR